MERFIAEAMLYTGEGICCITITRHMKGKLETWDYPETERLEDLSKNTEVHPLIHDKVAIDGNTDSTSREIENEVVQGAVLSVTLFLVAIAEICSGIKGPTRMLGLADTWVILTSNKTPKIAEARLQKAKNMVSRWADENGFTISTEKTKAMLIYRRKLRVSTKPNIKIKIGAEKIAKKHNLTKCLSYKSWGADQKTLLKIHQMILHTINVEVRRDSLWLNVQGGAEETRSHPSQRSETWSRNLRRDVLCKEGLPTLTEMRDENTMNTGIKILKNKDHPTRSQMKNRNIYVDYAVRLGSPKPFFI
jgi:hypothetical protein